MRSLCRVAGFGGIRIRRSSVVLAVGLMLGGVRVSTAADGTNAALLRLLQVLRDRGSITAQEYEDIRLAAGTPDPAPEAAPVAADLATRVAEQEKTLAEVKTVTAGTPAPVVSRALAGKWYERISLRGYTQLRGHEVSSGGGAAVEVPADRSVNPAESFVIRRGRFIFSGDLSDHLSLYAQSDFNASTGAPDFSLQMRDLYADVAFDKAKAWRIRLGQSKVPFGFVNLQSSQNRAPLERPDAINSAVEGERDLGASLMWASPIARQRFRDLVSQGLKGSGDYGVAAVGLYSGQGLNRSDQNGQAHVMARVSYPFRTPGGQFYELGVQAYRGRFVSPTQPITTGGVTFTPVQPGDGALDQRIARSRSASRPSGQWGKDPSSPATSRRSSRSGSTAATSRRTTGPGTASAPGSRSRAGSITTAAGNSAAMPRTTK
jgi:hypothetical protein